MAARRVLALVSCLATTAALSAAPVASTAATRSLTTETQLSTADRVVARVDVDGDRRRDVVRYQILRDELVRVSVRTARGLTRHRKLSTDYWPGGHWQGAALIDGRPGQELVIGTLQGAHTPWFTVLTWRHRRLVKENAPGRWGGWPVDAYANGYFGWLRIRSNGHVHMSARYVTRVGTGHHWTGRVITFTWRKNRWVRSSAHKLSLHGDHNASRIGGWHVSGLKRWPW